MKDRPPSQTTPLPSGRPVGEDGRDIDSLPNERLNSRAADVVISQDNRFHGVFSS